MEILFATRFSRLPRICEHPSESRDETTPSSERSAVLCFRQTFYAAGGHILETPDTFGDRVVKGDGGHDALHQATSHLQAFLRRQLECDA